MIRVASPLALGAVLLLVTLPSPSVVAAEDKALAAEGKVMIISSASVSGETVSCGCKKKDLGGISRRATLLDRERAKYKSLLLVDAGDFGSTKQVEPWMRTEFQWEMMAKLGYDAVTPGPNELLEGLPQLKTLLSKSPEIAVVSANITDKSGKPIWPKYTVIEKGGVRYGVTGVTAGGFYSVNLTRMKQKRDDFAFQDVAESIRSVVPEMRSKSDVVVVLLHSGAAEVQRLASVMEGVDVVIVGHNPGHSFNPTRTGETIIVRGGEKGQYMSFLELTLNDAKKIVEYSGESLPLGEGVLEEPGYDEIVKKFNAKIKTLEEAAGVTEETAESD